MVVFGAFVVESSLSPVPSKASSPSKSPSSSSSFSPSPSKSDNPSANKGYSSEVESLEEVSSPPSPTATDEVFDSLLLALKTQGMLLIVIALNLVMIVQHQHQHPLLPLKARPPLALSITPHTRRTRYDQILEVITLMQKETIV
ncbi:hypothetical protein CXB51_008704 [Gossypium anomalum]|uniref:Uncharacterized protein n=1 Tax=Gossypium anomalum TaxID=47600 RepID=A0A8J5Z9Q7_9ROSI|nr:hypothetical protein CXB51_008704 [Gossypium anomalum]